MKRLIVIALIAAVAAGAYSLTTGSKGGRTLGKPAPSNVTVTKIADAVKNVKSDPIDVAVKGEITQKCPTSGCWFYVKDDTGSIRVDTQFAGFNVLDVPQGSKVTVHGKISKPEDGEVEISAVGVRVEG